MLPRYNLANVHISSPSKTFARGSCMLLTRRLKLLSVLVMYDTVCAYALACLGLELCGFVIALNSAFRLLGFVSLRHISERDYAMLINLQA